MNILTGTTLDSYKGVFNRTAYFTKVSRLYVPYDPDESKPKIVKCQLSVQVRREKKSFKRWERNFRQTLTHNFGKNNKNHLDEVFITVTNIDSQSRCKPTNKALLRSFDANTLKIPSFSSQKTTPSPKNEPTEIRSTKKPGQPARFLSSDEQQKIISSKYNKKDLRETRRNSVDIKGILETDKKNLEEEKLIRKFRKHKYIQVLPVKFEDSWEWGSMVSPSPGKGLAFFENTITNI